MIGVCIHVVKRKIWPILLKVGELKERSLKTETLAV